MDVPAPKLAVTERTHWQTDEEAAHSAIHPTISQGSLSTHSSRSRQSSVGASATLSIQYRTM